MARYNHRRHLDGLRGPAPGDDKPRWPGAPVSGPTFFECRACGAESTLVYRCSECGHEPSGSA